MPQPRLDYVAITHKAEPGFSIQAPSLQRLYVNAALALTDTLVALDLIGETDRITIQVKAKGREDLMANWLNEILGHFSKSKFLCKRILFEDFDGKSIKATLIGERYEPVRHGHVDPVKGVLEPVEMGEEDGPDLQFSAKVYLER